MVSRPGLRRRPRGSGRRTNRFPYAGGISGARSNYEGGRVAARDRRSRSGMIAVENSDPNSFVLLQVGERRFALPSEIVVELAPPVRLHTFPHTSALVAGVIVRRGQIVPVYDVAPTLLGKDSPAHRFYLIVQRAFETSMEASAIPLNGEC